MQRTSILLLSMGIAWLAGGTGAGASDLDEFKVKREAVFAFAAEPHVTRDGDRVTISFETKGFCDVSVAVEDAEGNILRHLASGVLGEHAPPPFQKGAKKQQVVWDGKDDAGRYLDDKDALIVRVALGLKARYEKDLFSHPAKRIGARPQLLCAAPEGVYVYDCSGTEFLRLFDHDGSYVNTVYPFPAGRIEKVEGLTWAVAPQDGKKVAVRNGFVQNTLLDVGVNAINSYKFKYGNEQPGATALAVSGTRIALANRFLNRLASDGSSGGLPLKGPKTSQVATVNSYAIDGGGAQPIGPGSMAFSPDGKTVYLTGYQWTGLYGGNTGAFHGVMKMDFEGDKEPAVFAGRMSPKEFGSDNEHFALPMSVACDAAGRVYVADYLNDRVQVFDASGKLLKSLKAARPAQVAIHPKSQEIYVFSWPVNREYVAYKPGVDAESLAKVHPFVARIGTFDKPAAGKPQPLPLGGQRFNSYTVGSHYQIALDAYGPELRLWVSEYRTALTKAVVNWSGAGAINGNAQDKGTEGAVRLLAEKNGKWTVQADLGKEALERVARLRPPDFSVQRLNINPRNRKLYIFEVLSFGKCNTELVEVDPDTGKCKLVPIPFNAEDLCFDRQGCAYLRTDTVVARYDARAWREVPWDYGEERENVAFCSTGYKPAPLIAGLATPGQRPVCWNQGGMSVNAHGNLAVSCVSRADPLRRTPGGGGFEDRKASTAMGEGKPYAPRLYPGRVRWQELHIWDKHGQLVCDDAVPGLHWVDGVHLDSENSVYVLAGAARMLDGKRYYNKMASTVIKFRPHATRIVGSSQKHAPIPLPEADRPKRAPDVESNEYGQAWMDHAEWFYGGVGWGGFNWVPDDGGWGCACWTTRIGGDFYDRIFAPESDHSSVAVLDKAGNLILRVGRYANADSAGEKSAVPLGGDEVGLFYPCYVASDTDRRLFIADPGNARIVSVSLGYHAEHKTKLKDADGK